ncbi:DUF192 domain-containing protein [Candidatus Woesearchaeota archaeon]|nr:DUF192 domain-containing protein [Candidatus Woesearchaeota archaeon]
MIQNQTKKTTLVANVIYARTSWQKARGLMFQKPLQNTALIFPFTKEKLVPLHMCFVSFPIDVLFLNKDKQIVEIKENFTPWHFYKPKKKASFVIELPQGVVQKSCSQVGDSILF